MIEIGKTYKFNVERIEFGDIPKKRLHEFFKDGRNASFVLEEQLTHWFDELTRVEGNKDHDHVDNEGRKYDAKNFTKHGLKFMPSNQLGAGRKFNESIAHSKAKELIYICCDIVNFPTVRVKFIKGEDLIKQFPKCSIPNSKRDVFYG